MLDMNHRFFSLLAVRDALWGTQNDISVNCIFGQSSVSALALSLGRDDLWLRFPSLPTNPL